MFKSREATRVVWMYVAAEAPIPPRNFRRHMTLQDFYSCICCMDMCVSYMQARVVHIYPWNLRCIQTYTDLQALLYADNSLSCNIGPI